MSRLPPAVPIRTSEALRFWRTERGLSQRDIARLTGANNVTVGRWENGERRIPPWVELALNYLDLREDWAPRPARRYIPVAERAS